jgi:hypothetical protein
VTARVALLNREQIDQLPECAREVVEYRKSGLSLNHIQGCPLDCAYCIRHTYGLWDQRVPRALMTDAQAVEELVGHRYFQRHVTPVQVLWVVATLGGGRPGALFRVAEPVGYIGRTVRPIPQRTDDRAVGSERSLL